MKVDEVKQKREMFEALKSPPPQVDDTNLRGLLALVALAKGYGIEVETEIFAQGTGNGAQVVLSEMQPFIDPREPYRFMIDFKLPGNPSDGGAQPAGQIINRIRKALVDNNPMEAVQAVTGWSQADVIEKFVVNDADLMATVKHKMIDQLQAVISAEESF